MAPNSPPKTQKPAVLKSATRKVKNTVQDPIGIYFKDGAYKGLLVDLGTAILEVSHDQTAEWAKQDTGSIRAGSNFKSVSPRTITLQVEFYDSERDITPRTENLMTLQEIDSTIGSAPTLFYQEGKLINVSPVVCTSIKIKKSEPFLGDRGFKYAVVDLTLELLGGKTSDQVFAKPLTDTELTKAKATQTAAERERQGSVLIAKKALVKCLGEKESDKVAQLLESDKLKDVAALKALPTGTLIQIAVAGLIDKDTLKKIEPDLRAGLVAEMAKKTDGVGTNARLLATVIAGGSATLPPDLQKAVPQLQQDYALIAEAIVKQDLGQSSAVYNSRTANQSLINVGACGMSIRADASKVKPGGFVAPEQMAFFKQKLGAQADDPAAREKLVLEELNKALGGKDEEIKQKFTLSTDEELKALKNGKPYKSKDEFVQRLASTSTITGLSVWGGFVDNLSKSATPGVP